ncbi:unnamed protein product, partial [Musa hybrid cultivar]
MRFVDFFARSFASVSAPQFLWVKMFKESPAAKIADIPLCHISVSVYKTSVDWIALKSPEALAIFVLWCLDNIIADLANQQSATKGSKKSVRQIPSSNQSYRNMGKERAIVMEKLSNDDNGGGGSCGRCQQPWRKLRTVVVMVAKVANGGVVGGGSFKCVRWWWRKLWSYLLVMEGVVHGSSSSGGNCAQKLDLRTCLSVAKEALDVCVGSGGSSRSRHEPGQRSSV